MYIKAKELNAYDRELYPPVRLLELLQQQSHSLTDLAQKLDLDGRSIQRLIQELNKDYQRFTETSLILIVKQQNLYQLLIAEQPLEQEQFLLFLIQHSLNYRLTTLVLLENQPTIKELQQQLFISPSTVRRKLKLISGQLQPLQPQLQQGKVVFQAEEAVIRMYLSIYFWRLFRGKIWPFEPVEHRGVQQLGQVIATFFQIELNPIKASRLEYLLGAHLLRAAQKNPVALERVTQKIVADSALFRRFEQTLQPLVPTYFRQELGCLFLQLLTREEYYQGPLQPELFALLRQLLAIWTQFTRLQQIISQRLPAEGQLQQTLQQAEAYLLSGHLFEGLFPQIPFNINGKAFWTSLAEKQPNLVHLITASLQHLTSDRSAASWQESILFGRYLTVLRSLPLFAPQLQNLQILVQTDLPEFEEELLLNTIGHFLANDYRIHFSRMFDPTENYDLCLTTSLLYGEPYQEIPTLLITQELKMEDYLALFRLLEG